MGKCLYCTAEATSEEHVLPAAFGEFVGAPNLIDRLCPDCNGMKHLGLLDEQFSRSGLEGFMRKYYGVQGRSGPRHRKVNIFKRGSSGARRIEVIAFDRETNREVNIEITDDGITTQLCELILEEPESGVVHHIPLHEEMTVAELRAEIARREIRKSPDPVISVSCHLDEQECVRRLVQGVSSTEVTWSTPKKMSSVIEQPVIRFQVTGRYYRAFAKICFHYFLTQFPTYTGHEEMFAPIRRFIHQDRNEPLNLANEFIRVLPSEQPLNPEMRPTDLRHYIGATVLPGVCFATVKMFVTEGFGSGAYQVVLAKDAAITRYGHTVHRYLYYSAGKRGKFSGEATQVISVYDWDPNSEFGRLIDRTQPT